MRRLLRHSRITRTRHAGSSVLVALTEDASGVTAIEYTLIAALIVMALVALIARIGDFVSIPFETLASCL
jgi:Flp pilus assembly pilin Flp